MTFRMQDCSKTFQSKLKSAIFVVFALPVLLVTIKLPQILL